MAAIYLQALNIGGGAANARGTVTQLLLLFGAIAALAALFKRSIIGVGVVAGLVGLSLWLTNGGLGQDIADTMKMFLGGS